MPAFACLFVPDFPMAALLRMDPELGSQAVVVLEGKPPLQKVFALNAAARRAGVDSGMTKLQLEACDGLVLRPRSLPQESNAHAALLDCAQAFSPQIEEAGCDTVLLDLTGMETLLGPLPKIASAMAERAVELGLTANLAIASNADTALIAARGGSGIRIIPLGEESAALAQLPLEVLWKICSDISEASLRNFFDTFHRWGIRTLGALAALPEVALSERLGQSGIALQQLARGISSRGIASRTLIPVDPPLKFEETMELEHPLLLLEPLAFLLGRLLDQICARLAARALATQELHLQLELENGRCHDEATDTQWTPPDAVEIGFSSNGFPRPTQSTHNQPLNRRIFERTLRLPVPLLDAKVFLKLLQLDLKAHPPGAPIVKVRIAAEPAHPRAAQAGLFLPPTPEPERLELTLARIAGIVGEDRVGSLALQDTHRPEGFRMARFAPEHENKKNGTPKSRQKHLEKISEPERSPRNSSSPVTGLRILRPPAQVTVKLREGRPAQIFGVKESHKNQWQGEVLWSAGPWRSSGDWWEREAWSRDEWDIAVQQQNAIALCRLVRDLLNGRWFVEGTYD